MLYEVITPVHGPHAKPLASHLPEYSAQARIEFVADAPEVLGVVDAPGPLRKRH